MQRLRAFVYEVLLRPRPLRLLARATLRALIPERARFGAATVVLNRDDPVVSGSLAMGWFEPSETDFLRTRLRRGATFVDIGANIGYYSALAAHLVGSEGVVIAVEPDAVNCGYLEATVEANGTSNVHSFQLALAEAPGQRILYRSRDNLGDHRLYDPGEEREAVQVEVTTLDRLMDEARAPVEELFVKMDVQGGEGWVLQGAGETLRRAGLLTMLMEFWPRGLERAGFEPLVLLKLLQSYGVELHRLVGRRGDVEPIIDAAAFAAGHRSNRHSNIVGLRG